jgi:type II secretory pathway pseudopilin PulG
MPTPHRTSRRLRHPRAMILMETLFGLALAVAAIAIAGSAMSQYRSGVRQLQTVQNLKAQASACLLAMRSGKHLAQPPSLDPDTTLQILSQSPANNAPGYVWVQIRVTQSNQSANLWGLVPQSALPQTALPPQPSIKGQ